MLDKPHSRLHLQYFSYIRMPSQLLLSLRAGCLGTFVAPTSLGCGNTIWAGNCYGSLSKHPDSRNPIGKVTSGFLRMQSRTTRARFQGIQFAHDNLPNDRCFPACNDEIDHFTIDTADDTNTSQFNAVLHPPVSLRSPRKNLCAKPDLEAIRREP